MMPRGHLALSEYEFASHYATVIAAYWDAGVGDPTEAMIAKQYPMARNTLTNHRRTYGIGRGSTGLSDDELDALKTEHKTEQERLGALLGRPYGRRP